jgi:hypothetical protein
VSKAGKLFFETAQAETPPRGYPRFGDWDSPYLLLILIQTNKSRFGEMRPTELVSGENGELTLWWMEALDQRV